MTETDTRRQEKAAGGEGSIQGVWFLKFEGLVRQD